MANPTLHVRIISPQQILLDIEASSVSSRNSQGAFDILAQHANFITVIEKDPIIIRIAKKPASTQRGEPNLTFKFDVAIVYSTNNQVNIYTYIQPQTSSK